MTNNSPSCSNLSQEENQNPIDKNFSDQNKSILLSFTSEIQNQFRFTKNGKENDKKKADAISDAVKSIDKLEKFKREYLTNIEKYNNTIKELETKNDKINKKHNVLKDKMEKSSEEYKTNIKKKNDEITKLKETNLAINKELSEKLIQNKTSTVVNSSCILANQNVFVSEVKNEPQLSDKDDKIRHLQETINELQTENGELKVKNTELNEDIRTLQSENARLKANNETENKIAVKESCIQHI